MRISYTDRRKGIELVLVVSNATWSRYLGCLAKNLRTMKSHKRNQFTINWAEDFLLVAGDYSDQVQTFPGCADDDINYFLYVDSGSKKFHARENMLQNFLCPIVSFAYKSNRLINFESKVVPGTSREQEPPSAEVVSLLEGSTRRQKGK